MNFASAARSPTTRSQTEKKNDGGSVLITWLRSKEKPCHGLHRSSTTPKTATTAPGSKQKVADGVA